MFVVNLLNKFSRCWLFGRSRSNSEVDATEPDPYCEPDPFPAVDVIEAPASYRLTNYKRV